MAMNPKLLRPRDSGFNPRSITGLQLWLDANDASTMTLNGGTVSEWRSKVGSIAVTQATASAQPTLTANYFRARSALTFDGGDVLYAASAALAVAPCTTFIVHDEVTMVSFAGLLGGTPSTGDDFNQASAFITSARDSGNVILRANAAASPTATAMSAASASMGASAYGKKLVSAVVGSSTAFLRVNAVAGSTDTHAASGSSAGTIVGGRFVGGAVSASFRFNGRICEILHYSAALTTLQVSQVEKWLSSRWGVTL